MLKYLLALLTLLPISLSGYSQTSPAYEVYALQFAEKGLTPVSELVSNGPQKDSVNLIFMTWLIKGPAGKNILVDAGFLNDVEEAKEMNVTHYTRPDSMLLHLGIKADDITDIILTHPHWDHMDAISLFPIAHLWIQKEDYYYFVGTAWQKEGNHGGFNKRNVDYLVKANLAGKLTLVDGDNKELFPGIKVHTGSRHTFNSQYVLVQTGADRIVLASDNIWIYYNLDHLQPPPPYGTFDEKAYVQAMQRMKQLASKQQYIIPGHDSNVMKRFPPVTQRIVKIR
ncbi:MAG TPA: N-acyl homoserine lactonase family protein [Flavisolibacter sp.]|nr:N-acyl homoserine lactonase family protein [Flavisolibacter sp.]